MQTWLQHWLCTLCELHSVKSITVVPTSVGLDPKKMEVRRNEQWKERRELDHYSMWGLSAASGYTCNLSRILLSAWYLSDSSVNINRNCEQPVEISRYTQLLEKHIAWCSVNTVIKTLSHMLGAREGREEANLAELVFSNLSMPTHDRSYSSHHPHHASSSCCRSFAVFCMTP